MKVEAVQPESVLKTPDNYVLGEVNLQDSVRLFEERTPIMVIKANEPFTREDYGQGMRNIIKSGLNFNHHPRLNEDQ